MLESTLGDRTTKEGGNGFSKREINLPSDT